jgi:hypothetical protein
MPETEQKPADEFNGHDVQPHTPDSGPVRWICDRCKERSADINWFKKYVCSGQPDFVGGGG